MSRCRGSAEEQRHLACLRELLNAGGELKKENEHVGNAAGILATWYEWYDAVSQESAEALGILEATFGTLEIKPSEPPFSSCPPDS